MFVCDINETLGETPHGHTLRIQRNINDSTMFFIIFNCLFLSNVAMSITIQAINWYSMLKLARFMHFSLA